MSDDRKDDRYNGDGDEEEDEEDIDETVRHSRSV